jgi:transcriptional regulator with PAS, ATPase and Fis domain
MMNDLTKDIELMENLSNVNELTKDELKLILDNIFGNVFVTDGNGKLIYMNDGAASSLGITKAYGLGRTVFQLLEEGILSRSFSAEAIESRRTVVGVSTGSSGIELATTCKPIFDGNGDVIMAVTYSQQTPFMDSFLNAINKEKRENMKYRQAFEYLGVSKIRTHPIIISNDAMIDIFQKIDLVAKTDSTVVLYGESGVGKDVIATYIYQNSHRSKEPFIPVNCAAIPKELVESEFFGYTKGAFTGANEKGKAGIFELTNKGTLFLDEIAELSLGMQAKLLRVLETGEVKRIGSTDPPKKTDVRVIAATNKDLRKMVLNNTFREDLYYRLSVIPITIPPLRERKDEIPLLANSFLDKYNRKYSFNKRFSQDLLDSFNHYEWPGNIRELRNVVERLVITTNDDVLTSYDGIENRAGAYGETVETAQLPDFHATEKVQEVSLKNAMNTYEQRLIKYVLKNCNGNVSVAANRLGIHRSVLYKKIKEGVK